MPIWGWEIVALTMNEYDLIIKVLSFRNAIDKAAIDGKFANDCRFSHFPNGCCDDTCYLLSQYLIEHGYLCEVITGSYYDGDPQNNLSHSWIMMEDETVIDITGDQFNYNSIFDFHEPVYIGKETRMHKLFSEDRFVENGGICLTHQPIRVNRMMSLYRLICSYI